MGWGNWNARVGRRDGAVAATFWGSWNVLNSDVSSDQTTRTLTGLQPPTGDLAAALDVLKMLTRHPVESVEGVDKWVGSEVSSTPRHVDASDPVTLVRAVEGTFGAAKRLLEGRM